MGYYCMMVDSVLLMEMRYKNGIYGGRYIFDYVHYNASVPLMARNIFYTAPIGGR